MDYIHVHAENSRNRINKKFGNILTKVHGEQSMRIARVAYHTHMSLCTLYGNKTISIDAGY